MSSADGLTFEQIMELSLDDKVTGKFSSDEEYSSDADDTDDSSDDNISKSQVRGFPMTDTADDDHDTELDEAVKPWEIFRAIADADFEELEALRDSDAEFNCFDSEGLTPVMRASQADLDKFVRLMHKAGANLNTRSDNEDKSTALHFCAISGATKTIRMLIQLGADPKVLDENGQTPCSLAKTAEHLPAAKFLAIATGETTPEEDMEKKKKALAKKARQEKLEKRAAKAAKAAVNEDTASKATAVEPRHLSREHAKIDDHEKEAQARDLLCWWPYEKGCEKGRAAVRSGSEGSFAIMATAEHGKLLFCVKIQSRLIATRISIRGDGTIVALDSVYKDIGALIKLARIQPSIVFTTAARAKGININLKDVLKTPVQGCTKFDHQQYLLFDPTLEMEDMTDKEVKKILKGQSKLLKDEEKQIKKEEKDEEKAVKQALRDAQKAEKMINKSVKVKKGKGKGSVQADEIGGRYGTVATDVSKLGEVNRGRVASIRLQVDKGPLGGGWIEKYDDHEHVFFENMVTGILTYDDPRVIEDPVPSIALKVLAMTSPLNTSVAAGPMWYVGKKDKAKFGSLRVRVVKKGELPSEVWNKKLNRHLDIMPNPRTIVKVNFDGGMSYEDSYINANFVRGFDGNPKAYICAMGPKTKTQLNFWRMIWEQNVNTIVMTTNITEKDEPKCAPYWPMKSGEGNSVNHGTEQIPNLFHITCVSEPLQRNGYVISSLIVKHSGQLREIRHWWYNTWPDHGVPKIEKKHLTSDFLDMLDEMDIAKLDDISIKKYAENNAPILVHCSAGVGRTGTFVGIPIFEADARARAPVTVSHCRQLLLSDGEVDVLDVIDTIRQDRCALVQHDVQYTWIDAAIRDYATRHNRKVKTEGKKAPPTDFPPSDELERMRIADMEEADDRADGEL